MRVAWITLLVLVPMLRPTAARGETPDSLDTVPALLRAGRAIEAARLAGRQLTRLEAAPIADSSLYARTLDTYVEALGRSSLPIDSLAVARARLVLGLRERLDGPASGATAQSLANLARLVQRQRKLAEARSLLERAVAIRRAAVPADSAALATTLNLLGTNCRQSQEYQAARRVYEEALAIRETILPPGHGDIAVVLNNLGLTLRDLGEYEASQAALERAVAVLEAGLPPTHPHVYTTRNSLAITLAHRGDLSGARRQYELALAGIRAGTPTDSSALGGYLQNYGLLLQDLGDYASALRAHREAGAVLEARPQAPDSIGLERQRVNLALCYLRMGRLAEAEPLLHSVRAIEERHGDPNPSVLAAVFHNLSVIRREQSRYDESVMLADRALEADARMSDRDSAFTAGVLADRGRALRGARRLEEARATLERALALNEHLFGLESPQVAATLQELARVRADQGDASEAFLAALRSEDITRGRSRQILRYLGEEQSLLYASRAQDGLGVLLRVAAAGAGAETWDPSRSRQAFDALIRSRALVLDELAARRHAQSQSDDPELARLAARHREARERLAGLLVRTAGEAPDDRATATLLATRAEAESLGRALAERSAPHRQDEVRARAGIAEIARALGPGDAVIGFARSDGDSARSIAFVLRGASAAAGAVGAVGAAGTDPVLVPLGRAADVDAGVRAWREAVMRADRSRGAAKGKEAARARVAGERLRSRIWDPVVPHLEGIGRVFVVPEGELALVNWYALPVGDSGYLVDEERTIHLLSAERDLVEARPGTARDGGLLVVGDVDFERALPDGEEGADAPLALATHAGPGGRAVADVAPTPYRSGVSTCREFEETRFSPLPATRNEAQEIVALWRGGLAGEGNSKALGAAATRDSHDTRLLAGAEATEGAFKRAALGCRVIHAATHGFFLREDCTRRPGEDEIRFENPLLLSGLVLAGANRRSRADSLSEDGILTAEEVSSLALDRTEWVVLSACNSGIGAIASGEGVLGLRRAFQIAGARTLITSLWPVNDRAARRWMRGLYEAHLRDGKPTDAAVREATRRMLAERRAMGADTNPSAWASFVAVGDWR